MCAYWGRSVVSYYYDLGLQIIALLFTSWPAAGLTGLLATFLVGLKVFIFHFLVTRPARYVRRRTAFKYVILAVLFLYGPGIYADLKLRQAGLNAPNLTIDYKALQIPLPLWGAFTALIVTWVYSIIRERG